MMDLMVSSTALSERMVMMNEWKIVILDWDKEVCKTVNFAGDYDDARRLADKLLYSDEKYWANRVEFAD